MQGAARYVLTAGPSDVGHRVVVRRRLPGGQSGDLLGELIRWDDTTVVVRDRNGRSHEIDRTAVLAAKRIPPPPVRRTDRP